MSTGVWWRAQGNGGRVVPALAIFHRTGYMCMKPWPSGRVQGYYSLKHWFNPEPRHRGTRMLDMCLDQWFLTLVEVPNPASFGNPSVERRIKHKTKIYAPLS